MAQLKHWPVQLWAELDHRHIEVAIRQWQRRLNALKAQGGYFEQHLRSIYM